ncbi:MAG: hypothetical protein AVDCRST_MAG88-813 [uncultured Thermomicrobiales bacterium]|uniref:Uncharacterized protein n=1 Tax=uncultured Thermomicrobiales bacterium TaxID=1645740 RepID=A0A6J4UMQ6_9BACT|nr:MAG: hypothetical protein AVDCRST_MAG88-813 [uncultured Thermomicrobiales bacterium]
MAARQPENGAGSFRGAVAPGPGAAPPAGGLELLLRRM